MKCIILPLLLVALLSQSEIDKSLPPEESPTHYTDQQLKTLAIEYGVIPKDADEAYYQKQLKERKTITAWIVSERKDKVALIDSLRKMFLEKRGVIIKNPSEYYVDEINSVIYNSTKGDKYFSTSKEGVGIIFKTIALQEGDFDNGKGKVEALKEYIGEEKFEWYKEAFPKKFQFLVDIDKEAYGN